MHDDFGLRYINCGDWVESCTAVAERHDGQFEIITWDRTTTWRAQEAERIAASDHARLRKWPMTRYDP